MGLANLGHVLLAEGELVAAHQAFVESVHVSSGIGHRYGVAVCLSGLAGVALRVNQAEASARLIGAAEGLLEQVGSSLEPPDRLAYERSVRGALEALGEARFWHMRVAGRALSLEEAIAVAATLDPAVQRVRSRRREVRPGLEALSAREQEVARLIGQGQTSHEIAEALVITRRTADTHAAHIREKLGLRSRAEIAAWATQQGLT